MERTPFGAAPGCPVDLPEQCGNCEVRHLTLCAPLDSGEMRRLLAAPDHIDAVLKDGGERAGAIAATTMNDVKDIIGLLRD